MSALGRLIILTASRCLHGDDVRDLVFDDVARLFHDLGEGMTPLSLFLPNFPTPTHRRRDKVTGVALLTSELKLVRPAAECGVDMLLKRPCPAAAAPRCGYCCSVLFKYCIYITSPQTPHLVDYEPLAR